MHFIWSLVLIKIQRATTEKYCTLCALVKHITAYKDTAGTFYAPENPFHIICYEGLNTCHALVSYRF